MISQAPLKQKILDRFPQLATASEPFLKTFFESAVHARLPIQQTLASEGQACEQLALVLDGRARVYKLADSGREITLYRVLPGESCVLTASCVMSEANFPAIATTESPLEAIIVPANKARLWMTESPAWSRFVFGLISRRLADVISVLEEVAFQRMDVRIAGYLLAQANHQYRLKTTHSEIAAELGSSREVVSRVLKDMEGRGLLHVTRGEIELLDMDSLRKLRAYPVA